MKILSRFHGYSKSEILLIDDDDRLKVRKIGNIDRNLKQYRILRTLDINIPEIYDIKQNYYDMEFIRNLDMKSYLISHNIKHLISFILETLDKFRKNEKEKNYKKVYEEKLSEVDFSKLHLSFSKKELIKKLPSHLPSSNYHGDLTLDNILFDTVKSRFVLIDPLESVYDSYVFDIAKMRQDLDCNWFIRKDSRNLGDRLSIIKNEIKSIKFSQDNYILILMLLRIVNYANTIDKEFLVLEIERLWK